MPLSCVFPKAPVLFKVLITNFLIFLIMRHWISGLLLSTTVCVGMTVKNLEFETIGMVEKTIIEAHTGRLTGVLIQVADHWLASSRPSG